MRGFNLWADTVASSSFLAVAAIVLTLPLLLASLLPRLALPATFLMLVLIGLVTAWELLIFCRITGPDADTLFFVGTNFFTSAWVLAIAIVVRLNGYRLPAAAAVRPPENQGKSAAKTAKGGSGARSRRDARRWPGVA